MFRRLSIMLVLIVMVVSVMPVRAEVEEIGDAFLEEENYQVPMLVDEAEYLKIAQLQDTLIPFVGSAVSPDDTTVLINNYRYSPSGSAFMNIYDGSMVPIVPFEIPEDVPFFPVAATEVIWLDNDTLGQLLFDAFSGLLWFTTDRNTGQASLSPAFATDELLLPLSIAPNASRMIAIRIPLEELLSFRATETPQLPFSKEWPELAYQAPDLKQEVRSAFFAHTDQKKAQNEDEVEVGVYDLTTGAYEPLAYFGEDTTLFTYAWSKDGSKFAMVRDTGEYFRFGPERLIDSITIDALGEYAPSDNPFLINNVLDLFDFNSGEHRLEAIRSAEGDGSIMYGVNWSTDNQRFMTWNVHPAQIKGRAHPTYLFPDRGDLRFYDAQGNFLSMLNAGPATAPSFLMSPGFIAPDEVMFNAVEGMHTYLYYYNLGSGELRKVSIWDGTNFAFVSTNFSRHVIFTFTSFLHAPDIYRIQWDGQALARLTWSNAEQESINNIRADKVSFTLRNGGVREGYLIQPAGAQFPPQDSPIVVWQEGGPRTEFINRFAANVENPYNLLPNLGVPVLFVPLQGRIGFGPEMLNALADDRNFGQIDIDDMAEIVQQLVDNGWTSEDKVGVTGCSYGGYFAAQSITRHQLRYAAANPQCTLFNNTQEYHFNFQSLITYLEGVKPTDHPDVYADDSPMSRASAARTPTLLFHGELDFLPLKFAYDFHDQMVIQGYTSRLVVFFDVHGLIFQENQLRAAQEQVLWFRQHLGDGTLIPRDTGADVATTDSVEVVAASTPLESVEPAQQAVIVQVVDLVRNLLSGF